MGLNSRQHTETGQPGHHQRATAADPERTRRQPVDPKMPDACLAFGAWDRRTGGRPLILSTRGVGFQLPE